MHKTKYMIIGLIAGILLATAGSSLAASVKEKVTATIRNDFFVSLDGQKIELNNAPLAYDGSSYLPVKELSQLLGKEVSFKDGEIKLKTKDDVEMIPNGYISLRDAAIKNSVNLHLFGNAFDKVSSDSNNPTPIKTDYGIVHAFESDGRTYVNESEWEKAVLHLPK